MVKPHRIGALDVRILYRWSGLKSARCRELCEPLMSTRREMASDVDCIG